MEDQAKNELMRRAIGLSELNLTEGNGGPFGAIIVKDNKVIAGSANQVIAENDPTAHAEISAIRLACKELNTFDLSGCEIYTSCEPCPMCLSAIYWAKIGTVYYANTKHDAAKLGFDDLSIYKELEHSMQERKLQFKQLLPEEGIRAFNDWQAAYSAGEKHY